MQVAHHQSQRLALAQVFHESRTQFYPWSEVIESSVQDHLGACRAEIGNFTRTIHPLIRPQVEKALESCFTNAVIPLVEHTQSLKKAVPAYETKGLSNPHRIKKHHHIAHDRRNYSTAMGEVYFVCDLKIQVVPNHNNESSSVEEYLMSSRLTLVPAPWLARFGLSTAVDLGVERSTTSGWKVGLRMPRRVPDHALIFQKCELGDLVGVQKLLKDGDASVIDVDSRGHTPLHIAATYHHPSLCELLVAENSDVNARGWQRWNQTPFFRAVCLPEKDHKRLYKDDGTTESRQIQTFRKLIAGGYDIESESEEGQVLRIATFDNPRAWERNCNLERNFQFPSEWILKQILPAILERPSYYDWEFWTSRLIEAFGHLPGNNPGPGLLSYCEPRSVKKCMMAWCTGL